MCVCIYLFISIHCEAMWNPSNPNHRHESRVDGSEKSSAFPRIQCWNVLDVSGVVSYQCHAPAPNEYNEFTWVLDSTHPQMLILNWLYPLAHAYIANWRNHNFYQFLQNQLFLWPFSIANCNKLPVGTTFFPHQTFDRLPHHFAPHLAMFRSDFTFLGCYVPCIVMEGHVVYCI